MSCRQHKPRKLTADVIWCAACGSHRRRLTPDRWSRWIPCGVRRLTRARARQLDLAESSAAAFSPAAYAALGAELRARGLAKMVEGQSPKIDQVAHQLELAIAQEITRALDAHEAESSATFAELTIAQQPEPPPTPAHTGRRLRIVRE